MKLVTPCCKHVQEYTPREPFDWSKRHKTACKKCNVNFDVKKELVFNAPKEEKAGEKIPKSTINSTPQVSPGMPQGTNFPKYDLNIKELLKSSAISEILNNGRQKAKAWDILSRDEFINQGEIKHNIYWTSDVKPYRRPDFFYDSQHLAIRLMRSGHCMYQGGRQKIGKTTAAFAADFEDMLAVPGTVVTLIAPGFKQATKLLRQGFKEHIPLEDGSKFDLWHNHYEPYFIKDTVEEKILKNQSILQVLACSEFTTPGYASDILHIEELDKIVQDPQALRGLAAILPTVRARRDRARFRITCNNTSGIYRILREDLKKYYPHVTIYMEKPYDINTQKFSGEHIIYNEDYDYTGEFDIDVILKVIMDAIMGEDYTSQQLGNLDDYSGDTFNPDKLDIAYKKGKELTIKDFYEHCIMHVDPGAVHDFAVGILAREGKELTHLWNKTFSVSGKTSEETEKMLLKIAQECAIEYVRFNCEKIISESNSGARLIIPMINAEIRKEIDKIKGSTYAVVSEPEWSNWGTDKERGQDDKKQFARVDYIILMQYLLDYQIITLQDRNKYEHKQRIEFARYDPIERSGEKYKGNTVDSIMHGAWYLCGGRKFINELIGLKEQKEMSGAM